MQGNDSDDELETGADASQSDDDTEGLDTEVSGAEDGEGDGSESGSPPDDDDNVDEKTDAFQERVDALTRRFRESERETERIRAERDELRRQNEELSSRAPPEKLKTLDDFEGDIEAYVAYSVEQASKVAEDKAQQVVRTQQAGSSAENVMSEHIEREKAFAKTVDDYHESVFADDLKISPVMAGEIRASEMGPEVAYHLSKNKDVAARISGMPERAAIREMVLLEEQLRTETKSASKKVSGAPPPPSKVKGGTAKLRVATTDPKSDKMTDTEWFEAEEKRLAKMRG